MTDTEVKNLLMTRLSSAIRNSGDDRWIAEKLNNNLRLRGNYVGVPEEQTVRVMATLTFEELRRPLAHNIRCSICASDGMKPSHHGSKRCESGSIASGGQNSHCSCSTCF